MPSQQYVHQRLVVGYHGCDRETASRVLLHGETLKRSANEYDWLGEGIYFWEHGLTRAEQFIRRNYGRAE